jgi:ribosomal protein S27E
MKDPTKKSEFVIAWCAECRRQTSLWRVKDATFRCMECEKDQELPHIDHDRDGMLE